MLDLGLLSISGVDVDAGICKSIEERISGRCVRGNWVTNSFKGLLDGKSPPFDGLRQENVDRENV